MLVVRYLQLFTGVFAAGALAVQTASGTCTRNRRTTAVALEGRDGSVVCATSPPTETVTGNVRVRCMAACVTRASCGHGFNYRSDAQLCELYRHRPTSYQVQPNCNYFKVGTAGAGSGVDLS